jgi:hypothetical protein
MGAGGIDPVILFVLRLYKELQEGKWGIILMIGWTKRQHNITTHNLFHHMVYDIFEIDYKLKTRLVQMHEKIWSSFLMSNEGFFYG